MSPPHKIAVNGRTAEMFCSDLTAGISAFQSVEHRLFSDDNDTEDNVLTGSVLLQCAKIYGPVNDVNVRWSYHWALVLQVILGHQGSIYTHHGWASYGDRPWCRDTGSPPPFFAHRTMYLLR